MKFLLAFLFVIPMYAQQERNIEIFLFDLVVKNDSVKVEKGKNISQNPGYDNQPSFFSSDTLVYSGTRNDQTDIAGYSIATSKKFWLSNTKTGSEYSPQRIPESKDLAAVRLDTTGLQLLYKYDGNTGNSKVLLPELKVGYFFFFDENILVTAVLSGTGMDLVSNDLTSGSSKILLKNIGRSIHKVPGTNSMSYTITNEQNEQDLYILDMDKEEPESFFLTSLPAGVQDYAWLDQDRIVLGKGSRIFFYDILGDSEWTQVSDLSNYGIDNITRMSINKAGNKIALVAEID